MFHSRSPCIPSLQNPISGSRNTGPCDGSVSVPQPHSVPLENRVLLLHLKPDIEDHFFPKRLSLKVVSLQDFLEW